MRGTLPSYDECNALTLRFMADGKLRPAIEIKDGVVAQAKLSAKVLDEALPSGESRVKYRVGWACNTLALAGLLYKPERGKYQISPAGKEMLSKMGQTLSETDFAAQPQWQSYLAERAERAARKVPKGESVVTVDEPDTEKEKGYEVAAVSAIDRLNDDLAITLLQRLREGSPTFFEQAVIQILRAMEYGGKDNRELSHLAKESHTGKAGDGGIDGIIKLDPLGIQRIHIQAKRYKQGHAVGRPELQNFVGAIHGKGDTRGVFMTTSSFTAAAKHYAETTAQDRLVIIDGIQLTTLMLSYGVGVQTKQTLAVLEIDEDFFQ